MRYLVIRLGVACLIGGGLGACAPQSVAPVAQDDARVKTAAEARAVIIQQLPAAARLQLQAVEVAEQPAEWLVYVPFQGPMKPSGVYRVVDKQTGQVRVAVGL